MTLRSDIPQGTLDLLILKVVAPGPLHGYGIAQRLQQLSRDVVQVQQGSLYPALHRLENRGLLEAEWTQSDTGREAKFYRLTRKGREALGDEEASWRRLTEAIGLILYTRYVYLFEAAGLILLVAMVGAIVLTLHHKRDVRRQSVPKQVARTREESVELVEVETGRGLQ